MPAKFLHVKREGQRRTQRLAPPVPATGFLPVPMRETSAPPREVFVSPSESRTTIQVNRKLHLKSTANLTSSQVATSLQVKLELHFNRRSDFTSSERPRPLWGYFLGALRSICLEVIFGVSDSSRLARPPRSRRSRRSREQAPGGLSPPGGGGVQKTRVVARKRPGWLRAKDHGGCASTTLVV